jgi:hypothetical protein
MRKLWKGVLLGAAVGTAAAVVRELRNDAPLEEVGPAVAKTAGSAAAAGALVGFVLDRRARRKRSRLDQLKGKVGLSAAAAMAGATALADAAMPRIEAAAKTAKPKLEAAAKSARPTIEAAKAKLADLDLPVLVAV